MAAAVRSVDGICESQFGRSRCVSILERHFDADSVLSLGIIIVKRDLPLRENHRMKRLPVAVNISYKRLDTAFKVEGHFARNRFLTLVTHRNLHPARYKSHLSEALHQGCIAELSFLHDSVIWHEPNRCTGTIVLSHLPNGFNRANRLAAMVFLLPHFTIPAHCCSQPFRQGINGRNAHTMQPARNLIRLTIELTTRPNTRHDQFECRDSLCWMLPYWNTITIVINRN